MLVTDIRGYGFSCGITLVYLPGSDFGLVTRLCYESRPGSAQQDRPEAKVLLPSGVATQKVTSATDIKYTLLTLDLMGRWRFASFGEGGGLSLSAGPSLGSVLDARYTARQNLVGYPPDVRFQNPQGLRTENNGQTIYYADNEPIHTKNQFRLSLRGGIQGEFGSPNGFQICPGVFYDYGLSNVTESENWHLNSFLFLVDFRHAL
jgi:hypothetical protein